MDQGGPTDVREAYFKDAVDEMMRARTLCAKARINHFWTICYPGHLHFQTKLKSDYEARFIWSLF